MSSDAVVVALRAAGCVWAEDEARLLRESTADPGRLAERVARRVNGEPLEQILGWAQFGPVRVRLRRDVFVPRPRSLLLVDRAVALLPSGGTVLDLCCGSGALALAIATARPDVVVHAADLDPDAVDCARDNLAAAGHVHLGDLYAALPADLAGHVDVVVANVPYVPSGEVARLPREAREHEPRATLDGGPDGLDLLRRVAAGAPEWLRETGALVVEIDESQAPGALSAFGSAGLRAHVETDERTDTSAVIGRPAG